MDAASHGRKQRGSVLLSILVTWCSFLAAGGKNCYPKTAKLKDLPTKVKSTVAVTGKGLYPMGSRYSEGPRSKEPGGLRRRERMS